MEDLDGKEHSKPIDIEVFNASYQVHTNFDDENLNLEEKEEVIDQLKLSSKNKEVKTTYKIVSNLSSKFYATMYLVIRRKVKPPLLLKIYALSCCTVLFLYWIPLNSNG